MPQLTREQFEAARERAIASAPEGLSREQFETYLNSQIDKAEQYPHGGYSALAHLGEGAAEGLKGAASAVLHPIDTVTGIGKSLIAGAQAIPDVVRNLANPETRGATIRGGLAGATQGATLSTPGEVAQNPYRAAGKFVGGAVIPAVVAGEVPALARGTVRAAKTAGPIVADVGPKIAMAQIRRVLGPETVDLVKEAIGRPPGAAPASAQPFDFDTMATAVTQGSSLGPYTPKSARIRSRAPEAAPTPEPPPSPAPEAPSVVPHPEFAMATDAGEAAFNSQAAPTRWPPPPTPRERSIPRREPMSPPAAAAAPEAPPELPQSWQQFVQAESKAATPAAAATAPKMTRAQHKYAKFAAEGDELSQSEREAIRQELEARGFTTKIDAKDAARYRDQYGSLVPPGTKAQRQGKYIQDAIQESRYRFLLDNPKAGLVGPLAAAALLEGLRRPVPAHGGRE